MKKYYFFFLTLLLPFLSLAQKGIKIPLHHRVIINYPDNIVYAEILTTENKINPSEELYYYWFNSNDIKRTKGGFDGKLLHGTYTAFYLNKNLMEKGEFRYGVKKGKWKSWYMSGEFKEITNWRKGSKKGRFQQFDEKGKVVKEGYYKNDQYHGSLKVYSKDTVETFKYKNGKAVIKKVKVKKEEKKKATEDKNEAAKPNIKTEDVRKEKDDALDKKEKKLKKEKKKREGDIKIRRFFKVVPADPEKQPKQT